MINLSEVGLLVKYGQRERGGGGREKEGDWGREKEGERVTLTLSQPISRPILVKVVRLDY